MDKIAGVFARTLAVLDDQRTAIEHAFAETCPPTAIGRLENAQQFYDFLRGEWQQRTPDPEYLPDVAKCELAFAQARGRAGRSGDLGRDQPVRQANRVRFGAVRRDRGAVLLRCAYDIRVLFGTGAAEPGPARRDLGLAITTPSGVREPIIFELEPAIFELLAGLDDWTDRRAFGATRKAKQVVAELVCGGLLEERL
jgi:hypothetical protein